MKTPLKKEKHRHLRISEYYQSGGQFVVRILIGLGIYIVLRIGIFAILMKKYGLPTFLSKASAEVIILIVTALMLIFLPWMKKTRLQLIASIWMPIIACFAFVEWVTFFMSISSADHLDAIYGILPYVLPLTVFVIIWLADLSSRIWHIITSILLILLCLFWIFDIPKTLQQVRELHPIITSYEQFYQTLHMDHEVPADSLSVAEDSEGIHSKWTFINVQVSDYHIDDLIPDIQVLEYVKQLDIVIPGLYSQLPYSKQQLTFGSLEDVDYHYLYKYTTHRHIVLGDFHFSGDGFFRAEYLNGDQVFLDNVVVRKK